MLKNVAAIFISAMLLTNSMINDSSYKQDVISISENDGMIISENSYRVDSEKLENTKFEFCDVVVKNDGVYINNKKSSNQVEAFLGDLFVGWIIDGILYYVTGYSGAELAASVIGVMWSFILAHPTGFVIAVGVLTVTSTFVSMYRTNTGNECIRSTNSTFACKYSIQS